MERTASIHMLLYDVNASEICNNGNNNNDYYDDQSDRPACDHSTYDPSQLRRRRREDKREEEGKGRVGAQEEENNELRSQSVLVCGGILSYPGVLLVVDTSAGSVLGALLHVDSSSVNVELNGVNQITL